jgi:hypothetical protein
MGISDVSTELETLPQKAQRREVSKLFFFFASLRLCGRLFGAAPHIASAGQIHYTSRVEYPFPPVGIVGAADGKNRRAFFFPWIRIRAHEF